MKLITFDDLGIESLMSLREFGEVVPFERMPISSNGAQEDPDTDGCDPVDIYFEERCGRRLMRVDGEDNLARGIFLIHAHGNFSGRGYRQSLEGITILKHIRLTPWLKYIRFWHVIVYSFEPLEAILRRQASNLILTSPGVTFIRLPDALDVIAAVRRAHRNQSMTLESLAERIAGPMDPSFRPYVACGYKPSDSAHQTSNWWGVYEIFRSVFNIDFPEISGEIGRKLPKSTLEFAHELNTKMARFLEGERPIPTQSDAMSAARQGLVAVALAKTVVYVDDEAEKGWSQVLQALLVDRCQQSSCKIVEPRGLLNIPDKSSQESNYAAKIYELAQWVHRQSPSILILDLRLKGCEEASQSPDEASGMALAREVRKLLPYLPILLFTASNKAETLLIAQRLEVDDYWMKPGLGEHRGLRTAADDLLDLTGKLAWLLGPDYHFVQRIAAALSRIEQSNDKFWWEQEIKWPDPVRSDGIRIADLPEVLLKQAPRESIRKGVLSLLKPVLQELRIILRLEHRQSEPSHGSSLEDQLMPEMLRAAMFNQIGQVVELIHGFSDSNENDSSNAQSFRYWNNGTIGGRRSSEKDKFDFYRSDWWAFRLFALRNCWSHVSYSQEQEKLVGPSKEDLRRALSDLLVWLASPRIEPQDAIDESMALEIHKKLRKFSREGRGWFPILRLSARDPATIRHPYKKRPNERQQEFQLFPPQPWHGMDERFRLQLALRSEYRELVRLSDDLWKGNR